MKRIFTLTAAALLIAGCSPYQEQFRGLDERIASLKDEQAGTRQIVLSELDRLEKEILGKIDAMQEEVLDALDESVARAEDAILERTMTLRRSIRVMSARTGGDIEAWGSRLGDMVDQSSSFFEKSLERMKAAQEDAIRRGDKVQQERISLVQNKVTWMQANLSGLSDRAVNSVAALEGIEDKYLEINALLPGLEKRKDDMQIILSQYEEQLKEVMASRIKDIVCFGKLFVPESNDHSVCNINFTIKYFMIEDVNNMAVFDTKIRTFTTCCNGDEMLQLFFFHGNLPEPEKTNT